MGRARLADILLAAVVIFFSLNYGPMLFESFTSDRIWASHPPESFHMFQGPYGQKTDHYWQIVSPLATLSFLLCMILHWRDAGRRPWLIGGLVLYVAVQAATMAYFVPEQARLTSDAGALTAEILKPQTDRWLRYNTFRLIAGGLAFVCLLRAMLVRRTI